MRWNYRAYGSISVAPLSSLAAGDGDIYVWRPTAQMSAGLPPGFEVRLRCQTLNKGGRVFSLAAPNTAVVFFLNAALAGQMLLAARRGTGEEKLREQDFLRLYLQFAWHTREWNSRRFTHPKDLRTNPRNGEDTDILPDIVRRPVEDGGLAWGVDDVLREGRALRRWTGQSKPRVSEVIRRGLYVAAKQCTSNGDWTPNAETLIRSVLFSTDASSVRLNDEQAEWIKQGAGNVFARHLHDSTDAFAAYLTNQKADLVRRLAGRKKTPGGELDRDQVQLALAELAWRALRDVSECFDAMMQAFQESMPKPLRGVERARFAWQFRSQEALGNLPLLAIQERVNFIREAIADILDDPCDESRISVLHNMLSYYAEMADKRRAADRDRKRLSTQGKVPQTVTATDVFRYEDDREVRTYEDFPDLEDLNEVVQAYLINEQRIDPSQPRGQMHVNVNSSDTDQLEFIVIDQTASQVFKVDRGDFMEFAKEFVATNKRGR